MLLSIALPAYSQFDEKITNYSVCSVVKKIDKEVEKFPLDIDEHKVRKLIKEIDKYTESNPSLNYLANPGDYKSNLHQNDANKSNSIVFIDDRSSIVGKILIAHFSKHRPITDLLDDYEKIYIDVSKYDKDALEVLNELKTVAPAIILHTYKNGVKEIRHKIFSDCVTERELYGWLDKR